MDIQTSLGEFAPKFNWAQYNASQTREKLIFMRLLRELCDLVSNPKYRYDPKAVPMKDVVFGLALKIYSNSSMRRFHSDLKLAREASYVEREYHFNTMLDHMQHPELKAILKDLVEISALPLKGVEQYFAADATGFGTSKFARWFDIRAAPNAKKRVWRKCHAICGVLTNIVTSVEVTQGYVADITQFEPLVEATARNFQIKELAADKGYLSRDNMNLVANLGGIPFIPFKSNNVARSMGSPTWTKMFKHFNQHHQDFMKHYHKRSNIESVWSMIKARFGNSLKSRKEESQDNEILLKVLCHNLCVLVQEIFVRGIDINFAVQAEMANDRTRT